MNAPGAGAASAAPVEPLPLLAGWAQAVICGGGLRSVVRTVGPAPDLAARGRAASLAFVITPEQWGDAPQMVKVLAVLLIDGPSAASTPPRPTTSASTSST